MMNNEQIIKDIKSRLTGEKETDIAYLQTEMAIYRKFQNEEVIYAIANMMFNYMDKNVKERLDLKTHEVLDERRLEYETVVDLLNEEKYEEAKAILLKLTDVFEKATYTNEFNYYDFDQMIEYFIFCETVENGRRLKVKRYPEPVTYYMYQLAMIYLHDDDLENAVEALKKGLKYNPRCIYIMQELSILYKNLGEDTKEYNLLIDILKYGYAKDQLAFAYKSLAEYFIKHQNMDIAKCCKDLSETLDFSNKNDYFLCFDKYKVPYGISPIVLHAIKDFLEYTKRIKDIDSAMYIAFTAYELTDDEAYLEELKVIEKIKEAKNNE